MRGGIHTGDVTWAHIRFDILAVGFFVIEWTVYAVTLEHSAYGRDSLSARMHVYREIWIRRLLDREAAHGRHADHGVAAERTAFFCLHQPARGRRPALALLRSTSEALAVLGDCRSTWRPSPALWEIKCVGLVLIFVYAFFKFAWAYRLFQLRRHLAGRDACRPAQRDTPEAEAHVIRTTRLFEAAGRHFPIAASARSSFAAGLSRLVRQSVGPVRDDRQQWSSVTWRRRIRFQRLAARWGVRVFQAKACPGLDPGWIPVSREENTSNKNRAASKPRPADYLKNPAG